MKTIVSDKYKDTNTIFVELHVVSNMQIFLYKYILYMNENALLTSFGFKFFRF